jgi:ATP-dependent DNA helicase DinG
MARIAGGTPQGECENFLALARQQVLARAPASEQAYSLETALRPLGDGLSEAARALARRLEAIEAPLKVLTQRLSHRLEEDAAELDTGTRVRIEAAVRGLVRRGAIELGGWRRMLAELETESADFVDWLAIERGDGHEIDIGMHRHWIDPTRPFAETVVRPAHGVLITSATLTDGSGDTLADWQAAEARTGARHLATPALRARVPSPFDYPAQTRIFIVTDVRREEVGQVAAAYRELILAAGGGALGLFTAIARLRQVHKLIAPLLEDAGLPLLAQHVDAMDTATLEIGRAHV